MLLSTFAAKLYIIYKLINDTNKEFRYFATKSKVILNVEQKYYSFTNNPFV